jgi:glycosyltransferase involved in cell wall biosynthesis
MKILLLNYEYPPLGGGAGIATQNLLEQFKKEKDLKVDLVTSSIGEYKEEKYSENINIYYLDIGKKSELKDQSLGDLLKYSKKAYPKIKELDKENKYDLIHTFFGVPCGFLAMLMKKPYIVSLRGSDVPFYSQKYRLLDTFLFQFLYRVIWGKAEYVVANSQGLRDLAYKTIDKYQIDVIYNGVDINMFKPLTKEKDFSIVSTSRLIERKGLKYLIEGFAKFAKNKKDVRLDFYNEGNQQEELEQFVVELGIKEKVKFLGMADRKELAKSIPKYHIFALPSLNEGMSNSLLESLACGLAVIATDVGGTKELVDETNGIIVEKESSEEIFNALERLYKDRGLLESMGAKSRKKAEGMSWSSVAKEYMKLYKEI